MILSARLVLCSVTTVVLSFAGITYTNPEWTRQVGRQITEATSTDAPDEQETRRISTINESTRDRLARKTTIAKDVALGRMMLDDAAREYEVLNLECDTTTRFVEIHMEGPTFRLKCARQVILFISQIYRENMHELEPNRLDDLRRELDHLIAEAAL